MRVLIVDDDNGIRKVLTALLLSAGHEVVGALPDGVDVEDKLRELRPGVLCLDYNLPGRDGLSILGAVNEQFPEVDVLFMTASTEAGIEQRAADAGASGFIRKPFNQEQIIRELREVEEARALAAKAPEVDEGVAPPATTPQTGSAVAVEQVSRRTVVIADDSGSVRMVLRGLLDECGLRVVQAVGDGAQAINAVRTHRPGVLCLDVNMPVMGGLEALPLIRELSPETTVVMVTGCADRAFVTKAASLGAKGYILKPLRPAYVEGFMKKLLAA